jgi:hypothetical protein
MEPQVNEQNVNHTSSFSQGCMAPRIGPKNLFPHTLGGHSFGISIGLPGSHSHIPQ